jgi:hypothetical protein
LARIVTLQTLDHGYGARVVNRRTSQWKCNLSITEDEVWNSVLDAIVLRGVKLGARGRNKLVRERSWTHDVQSNVIAWPECSPARLADVISSNLRQLLV